MKNLLLLPLLLLLLGYTRSFAQCNPDNTPPVALCPTDLTIDVPLGTASTIFASSFNAGSYDACDPSNTLGYFIERLPQSSTPPSTTSITFAGGQGGIHFPIVLWVVDASGNSSTCITTLELNDCHSAQTLVCNDMVEVQLGLNGTYNLVSGDMLEGGPYCSFDVFNVRLDNGPFQPSLTLTTDDIGVHQMQVGSPPPGNSCWGTLTVIPGINLNATCPQLYVDIATNSIRPCINRTYKVHYVNASLIDVANTYVDVTLDDQLTYVSSTLPAIPQGNNVYRFITGDLQAAHDGYFKVDFFTDCDAPLGTTHCSEAHIYPDTICATGQGWSGALVSVSGRCEGDSIYLTINNIGTAPNAQTLDYVVVEDVLMRTSGSFSLPNNQSMNLAPIASNGATYRLEAQQEPGYPYGGMPSVSIEGCGGLNPGMVTLFSTQNSNPAISVYCRESTNSVDPNDKEALPKGYGQEHFIEKNTPLDYMIRFQNTGTDTAYKVVLVDTLSSFLNPQSLRLGASSHPYTFDVVQGNILRITFNNINLPHKAVNEDGSQGFVQFSIQQAPNNPENTRIENTAAIYFDFNAPIFTNRTFHTIGHGFVGSVSTHAAVQGLPQLKVYPNPTSDVLYFNTAIPMGEAVSFALTDVQGRTLQQRQSVTLPMTLQRGALENGAYFFRFTGSNGQILWSGKVMVK